MKLKISLKGVGTVGTQLCKSLRSQIGEGVYAPGAPLPSSRALAVELGLSRTTVTAAYDQLIAEGYLEARQGSRTRVASGLHRPETRPTRSPVKICTSRALSKFGQRVLTFPPANQDQHRPPIDFRYGDMSSDDFPILPWKQAMNRALLRKPPQLSYSDPGGTLEFRNALQKYLARARGIRCDAEQIIVVSGSQQALDLCARVIIDPGDTVVVENPGYAVARQVFEAIGATIQSIPVDRDGMQVDLLVDQSKGRLVYVTPSHQYPLGSILSVSRRQALLGWAAKMGAFVVEDDYDSEYRYGARPVEALQTLDRSGVVIYVSTFSKTLSPQLRMGYLVVPHALIDVFTAAKRLTDRHTPCLTQATLAEMLDSGIYERHVRRIRRINGDRRTVLLDAVQRHFGDDVEIEGADAGLNVVLMFKSIARSKEAQLVQNAHTKGIGVYPLGPLYAHSTGRPAIAGLVLGYASISFADIERGIKALAQIANRL